MAEIVTKLIVNCETGEETILPLTDEELADRARRQAEFEERIAAEAEKAEAEAEAKSSALAKLAALGLTEEEVKALIG